jgi:esterase/lipase superfamily enzyme
VVLGLALMPENVRQHPWAQLIYTAAKELFKQDCFKLNAVDLIYMPFHRSGVDMTILDRLKFAICVAYAHNARIELFQPLLVILNKLNESVYHATLLECHRIRHPHFATLRYIFNELKLAGKLGYGLVRDVLMTFLRTSPNHKDLISFLGAYVNQDIFNDALYECIYREVPSFDYVRVLETARQVNLRANDHTLRIILLCGPPLQAERVFEFAANSGYDIRTLLLRELENVTDICDSSARVIIRLCVQNNISFLRSARKAFQSLSALNPQEDDSDEGERIQELKDFLKTLLAE